MPAVKKRRGRPPGSKNKPKVQQPSGFVYDQIVQLRQHSDTLASELDATFDHQREIIEQMKRVEDAITALKGE